MCARASVCVCVVVVYVCVLYVCVCGCPRARACVYLVCVCIGAHARACVYLCVCSIHYWCPRVCLWHDTLDVLTIISATPRLVPLQFN